MKKATRIIVTAIISTMLGCGCGGWHFRAYDGPELPSTEVATIKTDDIRFVVIGSVDGKRPYDFFKGMMWSGKPPGVVYVLPGVHTIAPSYCGINKCVTKGYFAFEAKAGHTYTIRHKLIKGYDVEYNIDDSGANQ
jgi:hypothetical protein